MVAPSPSIDHVNDLLVASDIIGSFIVYVSPTCNVFVEPSCNSMLVTSRMAFDKTVFKESHFWNTIVNKLSTYDFFIAIME